MSEKALFFNALPDDTSVTGYDRNYNADDISDWLSIIWENGICKTNVVNADPQGLKVVEASGMTINVNPGFAAIKGKAYINNAIKEFTIIPNGTAVNRYDYIKLKYDNTLGVRDIKLELVRGTTEIPTNAVLEQTSTVYEMMLAYIKVAPSVTSITQTDIKDVRGTLTPWFTAVKGYEEYYDAIIEKHEYTKTLTSASNTVVTNISSTLYNKKYSLVEVFTNGLRELESAYTVTVGSGYVVINFTAQKASGAVVNVKMSNFIDGEGMSTALAQYTQLLQDVADLKAFGEYNYICNGVNDNVLIGNLVRAYLSGGTDYGSMKLNIIGNIGMSAPASGQGTASAPYYWFDFAVASNRNIVIDFSRCGEIKPTIANGSQNYIFSTQAATIVGATVLATNTTTDTVIRGCDTATGSVKFENCRFYITCYKYGFIAASGTFTNCRGSIASTIENTYCFQPTTYGVVKVIGGEYYAYTGDSSKQSAIVGQSGADAVSILYGVSAPTSARGGYYQTNSLLQWTGGGVMNCTDLITLLPMVVVADISNIRGTIARSKTNVW